MCLSVVYHGIIQCLFLITETGQLRPNTVILFYWAIVAWSSVGRNLYVKAHVTSSLWLWNKTVIGFAVAFLPVPGRYRKAEPSQSPFLNALLLPCLGPQCLQALSHTTPIFFQLSQTPTLLPNHTEAKIKPCFQLHFLLVQELNR